MFNKIGEAGVGISCLEIEGMKMVNCVLGFAVLLAVLFAPAPLFSKKAKYGSLYQIKPVRYTPLLVAERPNLGAPTLEEINREGAARSRTLRSPA